MHRYHALKRGDIVKCRVISRTGGYIRLVDLMQRGVICYPSALSQVLHGSKVAQGVLLSEWMMPHTKVIQRRVDLMNAVRHYNRTGIRRVVTKADRMHCGYGIRIWDHVEMLYSCQGLSKDMAPFLLQPFLENLTDVRIIIVGDYVEAYSRFNPDNFRMNLATGGRFRTYQLNQEKEAICRDVMRRGSFPYAHVDIHITEEDRCFLSEIALSGGIKGAKITRNELDRKKEAIIEWLIQNQ